MAENNNVQNHQQYESTQMHTDSGDLNNILAQIPTPVSNNIRVTSDTNTFMSPLQVDQQGYDRMNGVQYPTRGNDEVRLNKCYPEWQTDKLRYFSHPYCLLLSRRWMCCVFKRMNPWFPVWILCISHPLPHLRLKGSLYPNRILASLSRRPVSLDSHRIVGLSKTWRILIAVCAVHLILPLPALL